MNDSESRAELQVPAAEVDRRYRLLRERMVEEQLDAILVCGNQYAGFEGAVRYISGFEIVHRYVYVLLPLEGDPTLIFPSEARWIGASTASCSSPTKSCPAWAAPALHLPWTTGASYPT